MMLGWWRWAFLVGSAWWLCRCCWWMPDVGWGCGLLAGVKGPSVGLPVESEVDEPAQVQHGGPDR
jgi:hypothetical protein